MRDSIPEYCISSNGLYNPRIRKNGALDCTSEHFQPIFESQSAQHRANEIALCNCELNTEVSIFEYYKTFTLHQCER
jgi:hypothetical protein